MSVPVCILIRQKLLFNWSTDFVAITLERRWFTRHIGLQGRNGNAHFHRGERKLGAPTQVRPCITMRAGVDEPGYNAGNAVKLTVLVDQIGEFRFAAVQAAPF